MAEPQIREINTFNKNNYIKKQAHFTPFFYIQYNLDFRFLFPIRRKLALLS